MDKHYQEAWNDFNRIYPQGLKGYAETEGFMNLNDSIWAFIRTNFVPKPLILSEIDKLKRVCTACHYNGCMCGAETQNKNLARLKSSLNL